MGGVISIIYKMTHLPTGKFYIGSLKDSSRFSNYITSSKYVSKMIKENSNEWKREIIEEFENVTFRDVVIKEQQLIESYVKNLGWEKIWNKFYHVGVGECYSPETAAKRSKSQSRPETRLKKSVAMKITMNRPEMKAHLSSLTKKQMSRPEARMIIAEANSKRVHSEETRRKLSDSHKGLLHSPETKAKIAAAHVKRGELKRRHAADGFSMDTAKKLDELGN